MTVGQCPRDFCNDLNLCVNEMQPRLEEIGLRKHYENQIWEDRDFMDWSELLNLSAEARVDAALRAIDSVKAGAA